MVGNSALPPLVWTSPEIDPFRYLEAHGLDGLCGNRHGTAGLGREQPGLARE